MGYLLLNDTMRDGEFEKLADLFVKRGVALNRAHMVYIQNSEMKDLGIYQK